MVTNVPELLSVSLSLTKGQLAAAVVMLVSSLVFIGIYIYAYIRALLEDGNTFNDGFSMPRRRPNRQVMPQPDMRYVPETVIVRENVVYSDDHSKNVICHNCGATVVLSQRF